MIALVAGILRNIADGLDAERALSSRPIEVHIDVVNVAAGAELDNVARDVVETSSRGVLARLRGGR